MKCRKSSAAALLFACAVWSAPSAAVTPVAGATSCDIHLYAAERIHSVGEDFDAVHAVDQDLANYDRVAGRKLNWLAPERQLGLLKNVSVGSSLGVPEGVRIAHQETPTRHQAVTVAPPQGAAACQIQVLLPQIMLERGGLAARSLRVFGVVRRYENGTLVHSYSGDAAAPMTGFQLKTPADADGATAIVEQAYRAAVEALLRNSVKNQ